jgi:hypothetical protein
MGSVESPKGGLLLVHPRLLTPSPSNASTFLRWTKLHFRDLLNIPADTSSGAKVTSCMRLTAPDTAINYSHEEKQGVRPAYTYTCFVNDISVLKSKPYYDVSRKLNLELTRPLGKGEEAVGFPDKDAMVFDIVDAKFAVYECETHDPGVEDRSFQDIPATMFSSAGESPKAAPVLVAQVHFMVINVEPEHEVGRAISARVSLFRHLEGSFPKYKVYASLYRWAGKEAQPRDHPLIDVEKSARWMIMVCLESDGKMGLPQMLLDSVIEQWVNKDDTMEIVDGQGESKIMDHGVWDAGLLMR